MYNIHNILLNRTKHYTIPHEMNILIYLNIWKGGLGSYVCGWVGNQLFKKGSKCSTLPRFTLCMQPQRGRRPYSGWKPPTIFRPDVGQVCQLATCFIHGSSWQLVNLTSPTCTREDAAEGCRFLVKVRWTFQYVPSDYLSPFLADTFSEDSCCELKCRENRLPVTAAFKTLQKSHFRDTLSDFLGNQMFARHTFHTKLWKCLKLMKLMKEFLGRGKSDFSHLFSNWEERGQETDGELWEGGGGFTFYNLWYVFWQKQLPFKTSYVFYAREMILTQLLLSITSKMRHIGSLGYLVTNLVMNLVIH